MKEFLVEVRARAAEGYSKRQLVSSLIPDIGTEIKVNESEVTAALRSTQVAFRGQGRGVINYFLVLCCAHVFYFSLRFLCAFIGLFYRLHQHRELPFYSGPAA